MLPVWLVPGPALGSVVPGISRGRGPALQAYGGHVWGEGSQPIPPGTHLPHHCSRWERPCTARVDGGSSRHWSLSGKEGIVIYFFFSPVESHTEVPENWTLFIGVHCLS